MVLNFLMVLIFRFILFLFQFLITMNYLSTMNDEQTLVMYSGHPMGLFPSSSDSPRVVITNGMVRKMFLK